MLKRNREPDAIQYFESEIRTRPVTFLQTGASKIPNVAELAINSVQTDLADHISHNPPLLDPGRAIHGRDYREMAGFLNRNIPEISLCIWPEYKIIPWA
jgi:hypothetical protein